MNILLNAIMSIFPAAEQTNPYDVQSSAKVHGRLLPI